MSQALTQDPLEDAIDQALRETVFRMTPALLLDWIHDVAQKMIDPETIAERYGFADGWVMVEVIKRNPMLRERIRQERAAFHAGQNLEQQVRHQHLLILHTVAHQTGRKLLDPSLPPGAYVDMMKQVAVVAGVHGMPGGGGRGMAGAADNAPKWTIQMVFPNAGKVEEIRITEAPQQQHETIEGETV